MLNCDYSMKSITLKKVHSFSAVEDMLHNIIFRGLYNSTGKNIFPYKNAHISLTKVYPQEYLGTSPTIHSGRKREPLFTPQPTIYENQSAIIEQVDSFLLEHDIKMSDLHNAIEYTWEGRGTFHILPPVIEKHTYQMKNGYLDISQLLKRFKNAYIKDALGNMHTLSNRYLRSFYIDEVSSIEHLDVFNSNVPILNYGLGHNGDFTFYIVCDGAHRLDYVLEKIKEPMTVLLVEPKKDAPLLYPYYALPVPFRPSIRLSSKRSEKMYRKLERDKIHLLNDFIKKILHYDWEAGGLSVSKLRSNVDIY
ncbi:hypothetical protein MNBD_CPR01-517 [hydrothermal vent metagenome]|uniref:Uncharacterized protein n=1 Tax=hydrothermal vent metagenome TaxID=652676 RepID=A0A3B0V4C2_9ZZZZ